MRAIAVFLFLLILNAASPASAQTGASRPPAAAELTAGYAGFVDDAMIDHGVIAGALRFHLLPRISVGPEVQYMIGPGDDRDVILTGNLTVDVLPPGRRATPYFVAGGGFFHHSDRFGASTFSSTEGAFTAGGGVRGWLNDRVYVAGDFRVGWELHYRVAGTIGVALSK
jgi:hypothetical protein